MRPCRWRPRSAARRPVRLASGRALRPSRPRRWLPPRSMSCRLFTPSARRCCPIASTGDDLEIYGAYVAPDPDLVTFWLAERIDERGWGLAGDTFKVMDGLRELGVEVWFNLGDRDLAIGLERARAMQDGARLTEA